VPRPRCVGVDLVDVREFSRRFGDRDDVLAGVFTDGERAYCLGRRRPWPHLAARFAAKEAALKALGTGLSGQMRWAEIEVTRDGAGQPGLVFHGAVGQAVASLGVTGASVSLSHTADQAIAVVVLFR
jgi:holo-[acyl-carrier protein] synthase